MPTEFSTHLRCSYGTAELQLAHYAVSQDAITKEGLGRVGTKVSVEGAGYLLGTGNADFATKLAAAHADLATSGRDFIVYGLGSQVLVTIAAARSQDGGPHVKFKSEPGEEALRQDFTFTVEAEQSIGGEDPDNPGTDVPLDSYQVRTSVRPDNLTEIVRSGEVHGAGAVAWFLAEVVPAFEAAYPLPGWVTEYQYDASGDAIQSKLAYSLRAVELRGLLPSTNQVAAVEGELTIRTDRDEQMRKVTTYTYDLLFIGGGGNVAALLTEIRPRDRVIHREAVDLSVIRESRLRATFTILESADAAQPLMNWTASVRHVQAPDVFEVQTFLGADPVLSLKPKDVERVIQSGSSVAQKVWLKPPSPMYPAAFLEPPDVTFEDVDQVQKRTTWTYVMYPGDPAQPGNPFKFDPARVYRPSTIYKDYVPDATPPAT